VIWNSFMYLVIWNGFRQDVPSLIHLLLARYTSLIVASFFWVGYARWSRRTQFNWLDRYLDWLDRHVFFRSASNNQ
jgi:hypothetical protein